LPVPELPESISRLNELSTNLWWSWHDGARELYRELDRAEWRLSIHNPVKVLQGIAPAKLKAASEDPEFLARYDSVIAALDKEMAGGETYFAGRHPEKLSGPVAFFSPEFALHGSLPIYAGGLGVLAGDICKEASDVGLPMVGMGFMYPQGYFHQHISAEGWQEEAYQQLNFEESPIVPCPNQDGCGPVIEVPMGDHTMWAGAWQVRLGRTVLYLLDSNVEGNSPADMQLSARLYTADREQRIQQEILLGIGGVRILRALGIEPRVWHANEGHTAFMMLERIREKVERGGSVQAAIEEVRRNTVFTTHTPVPAGNDVFPLQLIDKYFSSYWESLGMNRDQFVRLGSYDGSPDQGFNMTILSLKLANYRTGVSKIHGEVARSMWHGLWPELSEQDVPITHVTNGVHSPTWTAPELSELYRKYIDVDIMHKYQVADLREKVMSIPDDELWVVRKLLKQKLMHHIIERAQERWTKEQASAEQVLAMGALLDNEALTIGFVRRFAAYKRPSLIFRDIDRLKRIISDPLRPVQIVFAGKCHPADFPSKYLIHQVYSLAKDRGFEGRIAFVEDYDMHVAHYLVQGVDVWLNNPRRRQEASGTSGMKAAFNGIPHMSVLDGWWDEGYNGRNGWAIGKDLKTAEPDLEDAADAESIYEILEKEIIPLYYDRDRHDVPHGWLKVSKETIAAIIPLFSTRRLLDEYIDRMYLPAARSGGAVP
jgi:glycogen phosphorylase